MTPWKAVFVLVALVSLAPPARAQDIHLGVAGGVTFATFGGDLEGLDRRVGAMLEGRLAWSLAPAVTVQTGLGWIQKGGEGEIQGFEEPVRAAHTLSYLQVPLTVRVTLPRTGPVRPVVFLGPTLAFETGCRSDIEPTSAFLSPVDCNPDSAREQTEWSLLLGGGVTRELGSTTIFAEGQYHRGLTDLQHPAGEVVIRNRTFSVVLGASFAVGG